jgi:hypothetical protein
MVDVCCAAAASHTSGADDKENWSMKWCSTDHAYSKPASSATRICSIASQNAFRWLCSSHGRSTSTS